MATGKIYYWIKIKTDFMTSDKVDFLMSQPNGANYIVLYQMLCLKCINTDGVMARQIGEVLIPYDIPKIERDCKYFSQDTIMVALNLFRKLGMIYQQADGCLAITDFDNMVGKETDYAQQKRIQRNACGQLMDSSVDNVHTEIRDKSIDIRYKSIDKEINNKVSKDTYCSEVNELPAEPTFIMLTLNDKSEYPISESKVKEYEELYPAVDVKQQLRNMKGWCNSNPSKRKTKKGIERFVNQWLQKEQDKPHINAKPSSSSGLEEFLNAHK